MTSSGSAMDLASSRIRAALRSVFVFGTTAAAMLFEHQLLSPSLGPLATVVVFVWLFAAVVVGALTVVAHADELARML